MLASFTILSSLVYWAQINTQHTHTRRDGWTDGQAGTIINNRIPTRRKDYFLLLKKGTGKGRQKGKLNQRQPSQPSTTFKTNDKKTSFEMVIYFDY